MSATLLHQQVNVVILHIHTNKHPHAHTHSHTHKHTHTNTHTDKHQPSLNKSRMLCFETRTCGHRRQLRDSTFWNFITWYYSSGLSPASFPHLFCCYTIHPLSPMWCADTYKYESVNMCVETRGRPVKILNKSDQELGFPCWMGLCGY